MPAERPSERALWIDAYHQAFDRLSTGSPNLASCDCSVLSIQVANDAVNAYRKMFKDGDASLP